jgi:DNA (cytosine-5)-methyltransferase 1
MSRVDLDFFVFENVPGLIKERHLRRYQLFKHRCETAGFNVWQKVVDAGKFGIPQHRTRLIVVGLNRQRFPNSHLELPEGDRHPLSTRAVLEGLPEPTYFKKGLETSKIPYHPNHVAMVPRSPKFSNGKLEPGDCRGRSFRVLSWDAPSYTVAYGHREVHIHPALHRRLSVFEAMLLQGFPFWYELKGTLSQQIQLVSDAVPPPLGEGIAKVVYEAIGYASRDEPQWPTIAQK